MRFDGVITDSSGVPMSNYTFTINVDSLDGVLDTGFHTKVVTTNLIGEYRDSMYVTGGVTNIHFVYYLASCGNLIDETASAVLVNNTASINKDIKVCGLFEWELNAYANIYANPGTQPQYLTVNVLISDTLGNGIDSFDVYKGSWTSLVQAQRQIGWAYHAADIRFRFTDCNGNVQTSPMRGRMGQVNNLDMGDYYTCVPVIDSMLVYLQVQDSINNRSGLVYLIQASIDTTVSPFDTLLSVVDTFPVNNRYYVFISGNYSGNYYMKFVPNSADPLYSQLLPTYWGADSPLTWREADAFTFGG